MSCIDKPAYSLGLLKDLLVESRKNKTLSSIVDYDAQEFNNFNKKVGGNFRDEIEGGLASCLLRCYKRDYLGTKIISVSNTEIYIDCYKINTEDFDKNSIVILVGFKATAGGTYFIKYIRIYDDTDPLVRCLKQT